MLSTTLLVILVLARANTAVSIPTSKSGKFWKGFARIDYLFTSQWRSSNRPNWVDYMTTTFNQSKINSINYAFPGATTDEKTTSAPLFRPTIQTQIGQQCLRQWGPQFVIRGSSNSDNSLFVLLAFPGNDIVNSLGRNDSVSVIPKIFETYDNLIEQLYAVGGRNLVFNNLPDLSKAPIITVAAANGSSMAVKTVKRQIKVWNEQVISLVDRNRTRSKCHSVTIFEPDMYSLFEDVYTDPKSHPETASITNTRNPCPVASPISNAVTLYPQCVPYLFIDQIHIQSPMHKAIARKMVQEITGEAC
ncbi:hypothetical protein DL95DRAFT_452457 [Leptodontidium sp. 2 PMI_412]|nr:hypothetical protein DL95DRAFT_452457 [Leptodontidium sp. 2 PMI_412]